MYQTETMDAVRDAAETLTREGIVLTIGNPEFPLAVFADTYKVDDVPTNTELPNEEIVAVEEHFDEINQESTVVEDDTRESIVSNLYAAVATIQFNATNVIIPAIKAMHTKYATMQSGACEPEYSVRSWRYLAPHNSPGLVNHINTRYTTVQLKDTYRSFHLESQSADSIIEMMAVNNPHLEQEEVTEWALQVGSSRLEAVWSSIFQTDVVVPATLPYLTAMSAPFNVDDILAAYFICGHYIDNPQNVPGVSVDLDEWEHTLKVLHQLFGFYLTRAYTRRADQREFGLMILTNEATNAINTRRAVVVCNGDVFDPWVLAGGDIQAILGAAIENTGITDARHIDANAAKFIARWHGVYPLLKQAAIDYSERQQFNNVISAFHEITSTDILKELYTPDLPKRLQDAMGYIRRDEYVNPYKVFSTLICRVYYPESTYIEYLDAIDQYGQDFPKATVRELATQAMITLVAIFQAKQITSEPFQPEIIDTDEVGQYDDSNLLAVVGELEDETVEDVTNMTEVSDDIEGLDNEVDGDIDLTEPVDSGEEESEEVADTIDDDFDDESEEDPYSDFDDGDADLTDAVEESEVEETAATEPEVEETSEDGETMEEEGETEEEIGGGETDTEETDATEEVEDEEDEIPLT